MVQVGRLGQVRGGGAEGLEGVAHGVQVRPVRELVGDPGELPPTGGWPARQVGSLGLAQAGQDLEVPRQVVVGQGRRGVGGGEDQGPQQAVGGLVVGLGPGLNLDRGAVVVGRGPHPRMGELGLGVQDQCRLGHHPITLGQAGGHLDLCVAGAPEADLLGPVSPFGLQVYHRPAAMLEDRAARHQQGLGAGLLDQGRGGLAVQQVSARVFQHYPNPGGAGHFVEVRVDEGDGGGQHPVRQGRDRDLRGLAHSEPGEVWLVGVEDEPHAREVAHLEQPVVGLDVLALVDAARHHGAGIGGAHRHHGRGLEGPLQDAHLLLAQAQFQQALPGRRPVRGRGGDGPALDPLHVLALGGEHVRAVDGGQRRPGLDLGADIVDLELFDAPGHPG